MTQLQEIANADFSAMSYDNLRAVMETISKISTKVERIIEEKGEKLQLTRQYVESMLSCGVSGDEILRRVESFLPENNDPDPVEVVPLLPSKPTKEEPIHDEAHEDENNECDPLFECPEFQVVFNPLGKKPEPEEEPAPAPEPETVLEPEPEPVPEPEEELQTLDELLSDDPRYQVKEVREPIPQRKKNRLLSMDELMSNDPINKIITMGYATNSSYKQNDRIFHADGIIGAETASGKTYVYIS